MKSGKVVFHDKCSNLNPFKVGIYLITWIPRYRKKFAKRLENIWVGGSRNREGGKNAKGL